MIDARAKPHDANSVVQSVVARLIGGAIAWALGTAALLAIVALSSIPYGGGPTAPLYLVIPWTFAVIYWVMKPLGRQPSLSAPKTVFIVSVVASSAVIGGMYWWLGGGERERSRATHDFQKAMEPHSSYFGKLCASSGIKVFRQVKNVEGFTVYGVRNKTEQTDLIDKNFSGDVYSQIDTAINPELSFVSQFLTKLEWEARWYTPNADETTRYAVIEIPAVVDGVQGFYRHTDASMRSEQKTNREFVKASSTAYAVRIEDISSAADREHWIAGTKWSVVDIASNEVMGEFIAYAMDPLQGQTVFQGGFGNAGEPWPPWLRAGHAQYRRPGVQLACPEKDIFQKQLNSRDFVRSVLVPKPQDIHIIPAN
jgi:hypothetical protein